MMSFSKEDVRNGISTSGEYASGKYIFGNIGYLFARVLIKTRITPNQITWIWGGIMIISSILFVFNDWILNVIGGLGWLFAYSLDYTDGCIARLKGITSKRGAFLDLINHSVTYPLMMFCIGIGVFLSGGCPYENIKQDWFQDYWYMILGFFGGISLDLILLMPTMFRRFNPEDSNKVGSSSKIEGGGFKNQNTFKKIMNINPLTFTNMMFLILVFAIIDQMWLFVLGYGICYAAVAIGRFTIMYRQL